MRQLDPWQVMTTHHIQYNGEPGKVELIQTTNRTPEFFFFVHFPSQDILLNRFSERPEFWIGSGLPLNEAKALGEFIEEQIGYQLPLKACNNPFLYKLDIQIKVERFQIDKVTIDRAKAPYTKDIFYQIHFSKKRKVTMVKMDFLGDDLWTYDGPIALNTKDFETFKSMLEPFEVAYQLGIYKAVN